MTAEMTKKIYEGKMSDGLLFLPQQRAVYPRSERRSLTVSNCAVGFRL